VAEWVTLALSVAVVGALVAFGLIEESQRREEEGPNVSITFDIAGSALRGESYYLPYTVTNSGSEAVTSAEIWIDVLDGERLVQTSEIMVEFLPLEGRQDGVFVSSFDLATHTIRGRVESIQVP
jgi:uncharacterized protein (TIGR02588 family)